MLVGSLTVGSGWDGRRSQSCGCARRTCGPRVRRSPQPEALGVVVCELVQLLAQQNVVLVCVGEQQRQPAGGKGVVGCVCWCVGVRVGVRDG